jgi:hypothetical protein
MVIHEIRFEEHDSGLPDGKRIECGMLRLLQTGQRSTDRHFRQIDGPERIRSESHRTEQQSRSRSPEDRIGRTPGFKEGNSVYTIGYPLPYILDKFLDDFKPTLTDGIISAIRKDKWDIQHTASINPGNSGGPLLTKNGKLIGVNVGQVTKANSLYFSVISKKIVTWLREIGKGEIITYEKNEA